MSEETKQSDNQNNQNEVDLNKFSHAGGYSRGCKEGYHDYNKDKTELKIADNETLMIMKCSLCGAEVQQVADLGINDLIGKYEIEKKDPNPPQPIVTEGSVDSDGFSADDFWNKIGGK